MARQEAAPGTAREGATVRVEGKLLNAGGEFIASGPCEINRERAEVTMWPSWEVHMLERQRGPLVLELEDGRRVELSDRHLTFKLAGPTEQRVSVYRLHIVSSVPEHLAAGYVAPEAQPGGAPAGATGEPADVATDAATIERGV
jgi:hypothetical protein